MPKGPDTPRMWLSALFGCSSSTDQLPVGGQNDFGFATKPGMTAELAVEHSPPHVALLSDR
jgi:hypothetical protein